MAFDGRVFRVLIASPSDVHEEREIAVRVIQEWNDLHAYSRGVVILPLRWETHAAPEFGTRPQEVINRAIVDDCDLLIGVFWTRIGTPTGVADSGTLEEIERVAKSGKPVMLYFSKVGADPDQLDLQQMARLKEFKSKTYSNALNENYKSLIEFRDKLARQIELKVRELQTDDSSDTPRLTLEFVEDGRRLKGTTMTKCIEVPSVANVNASINAMEEKIGKKEPKFTETINKLIHRRSITSVQLAINNSGSSSLRNLYIEILVKLVSGKASVPNRVEKEITEKQKNQFFSSDGFLLDSTSDSASIAENGNLLRFSFEWPAIQPRLVKSIEPLLHFQAEENSVIAITARVFADSFREPVELQSKLHIDVAQSDITLEKYFGKVDINTRSTFSGQSKIANFLQCFFEKDPGVRQDTILGFDDEFISEVLRHLSDKKFDAQKKGTEG